MDDYSKGNFAQTKTTLDSEGKEFRIEKTKEEKSIPQQYIHNFESIAQKYESVINVCLNENKEGKYVVGIVKDLRKKIITNDTIENQDDFDCLYFLPWFSRRVLQREQKFREYFDAIVTFNNEINKREKDIEKMRKEEKEIYKRSQMSNKSNNTVEEEKIFAAMFGNGIFI